MTHSQRKRRTALKLTSMTQALIDRWEELPPYMKDVLRRAGMSPNQIARREAEAKNEHRR